MTTQSTSERRHRGQALAEAPEVSSSRAKIGRLLFACIVAGLVVRAICIWISPRYGYLLDHLDYIAWSHYAFEHGPLRLYDMENRWLLNTIQINSTTGERFIEPFPVPHAFNYPPLTSFIFYLQGALWNLFDSDLQTFSMSEEGKNFFGFSGNVQCTSPLVNTHISRAITGLTSVLFDFMLAWGVYCITKLLVRPRDTWVAVASFLLIMIMPPIFLNSAIWNQADSWVTCPCIWSVYMILRRRWFSAGALWGLAIMTKPQAILLVPLLICSLGLEWRRTQSANRAVTATAWLLAGGLLIIVAIAIPFSLQGAWKAGDLSGSVLWINRSYFETIGGASYNSTTLDAFNLWWLDAMRNLGQVDAASATRPLLGVSKPVLGLAMFGLLVAITGYATIRRQSNYIALLEFGALSLLAAFSLLARVHERYIYYSIPFFIVIAMSSRRWLPILGILTIVGTAEMTTNLWLDLHLESARRFSVFCAIMTMLMLTWGTILVVAGRRHPDAAPELAHN